MYSKDENTLQDRNTCIHKTQIYIYIYFTGDYFTICGTMYIHPYFQVLLKFKVNQPIPVFKQGNPNGGMFTSSTCDKGVHGVALYLGLKLSIDAPMFSTIKGSGCLDEYNALSAVRFTSIGGGALLGGDPDLSGSERRK